MKLMTKLAMDEIFNRGFISCCDRADADISLYEAGFVEGRKRAYALLMRSDPQWFNWPDGVESELAYLGEEEFKECV